MDSFKDLKEELLTINTNLISLFTGVASIPEMEGHTFGHWELTCAGIKKQIQEEVFRVAAVGAIKSGKSTFINSLLKGDYLKRGAGVITSIVTRIRSGRSVRAKLYFKSWDEVNADIEQAIVLFPALDWESDNHRFDIRREKDRSNLDRALDRLGAEHLISNDGRDVNSVLLSSYLKGYDRVSDLVGPEPAEWEYSKDRFAEHRQFSGNEILAVYLKDIELEIDSIDLDDSIEIADCQGSDSPNPIHLSLIQDYLLLTNLIIYVISSRTGLRQADIKFLSIIKKMGILENILFVINCDFSEHDTIADLQALVKKTEEELSMLKPEPEVFTLSALFDLFSAQTDVPNEKDRLRLEQWEKQRELVAYSRKESDRFAGALERKLTSERYPLLLHNNLERLGVISSGVSHWVNLNRDLLERDAEGAGQIVKKITEHQKQMNQIQSMIKSTLGGAIQKLKSELKADVDRFFDVRSGHLMTELIQFLRAYNINFADYEENLVAAGFTSTLYLVFQEFRQGLNTYLAESVNPEIVRFIKGEEVKIKSFLESVAGPYDAMVQEALADYGSSLDRFGLGGDTGRGGQIEISDMDSIKTMAGLTLPPAVVHTRYTAKIRTEAVMRLGFYSVVKVFKKVFKKPLTNKNESEMQALKDGVRRMKRETERSVLFHFKDYRENLKYQYIFKLVDAASGSLDSALLDRFQAYGTDLTRMAGLLGNKKEERQGAIDRLNELKLSSAEIEREIVDLREKIQQTEGVPG